jgi:hypothetical protein
MTDRFERLLAHGTLVFHFRPLAQTHEAEAMGAAVRLTRVVRRPQADRAPLVRARRRLERRTTERRNEWKNAAKEKALSHYLLLYGSGLQRALVIEAISNNG